MNSHLSRLAGLVCFRYSIWNAQANQLEQSEKLRRIDATLTMTSAQRAFPMLHFDASMTMRGQLNKLTSQLDDSKRKVCIRCVPSCSHLVAAC